MAELRLGEFNSQNLANTAWSFAIVDYLPVPWILDQISVLDAMEAQGTKSQGMYYRMSMHGLTAAACLEQGFMLLLRAEANGLLSHFHEALVMAVGGVERGRIQCEEPFLKWCRRWKWVSQTSCCLQRLRA